MKKKIVVCMLLTVALLTMSVVPVFATPNYTYKLNNTVNKKLFTFDASAHRVGYNEKGSLAKPNTYVAIVQRMLVKWGRAGMTDRDVDGSYGDKTKNAIAWFQKSYGLYNDGIVGPDTWRYLTMHYETIGRPYLTIPWNSKPW